MAKIGLFRALNTGRDTSPNAFFSCPNDGRVTFVAIGAGVGPWSATLVFSEYVNGFPVKVQTLTISEQAPIAHILVDTQGGNFGAYLSANSSNLGTFEVGGFVDAGNGASMISMVDLGMFAADADKALIPTTYMETGARATLPSGPFTWRGAEVGWVAAGGALAKTTPTAMRELSYYGSANTIALDRTISMQIPADADFSAVRLAFHNYATDPLVIGPVWVAAAANSLDTGTGLTWVQVLFGGNPTVTIPAATRTALGGGVAFDVAYTAAKSDVVYIKSIARADGTKFPFLQTRCYLPNGGVVDILDDTLDKYKLKLPAGKAYAVARSAGDVGTSKAAVTLASNTVSLAVSPACIEFYYTTPVVSVVGFGDSIQSGAAATDAQLYSPLGRAVKSLNESAGYAKYSFSAFSMPSQKLVTTLKNVASSLAKLSPTIVRIPTASPNDGAFTSAQMELYWAYTMQMVEIAEANRSLYYLVGPTASWAGGNTANLIAYNDRARNWCLYRGVPFVDAYTATVDPANSGAINPIYSAGDNVHLNGLGYDVIAALDATAIKVLY